MSRVLLKKSSVASKIPLSTDLQYGEVALNYTDGKLYYKNSSNTITAFSATNELSTILDRRLYTITVAGSNTLSVVYVVGYVDVYVNGVKLNSTEFTAIDGTTVVLPDLLVNDEVQLVGYRNFTLSGLSTSGTGLSFNSATSAITLNSATTATANTIALRDGSGNLTATNLSGTNTGDNAVNSLYSGLVSNATHTGDVTGSTALTLATVNTDVGAFGSATNIPVVTVNAKGLVTAVSTVAVSIPSGAITITGDVTGSGTTGSSTALTLATVNANVGTWNNVTVNGKGLVTAGSNTAYLTAEADTLATVTGRGATTATAITLSYGTANGVTYLNGSKVLTSGTALTFDGSALVSGTGIRANSYMEIRSNTAAFYWENAANTLYWSQKLTGSDFAWDYFNGSSVSEAMRLTSTGLGIGTSSPAAKLDIRTSSASTSTMVGAYIYNESTTTNTQSGVGFFNYDNFSAKIYSPRSGSTAGILVFGTNAGTGVTESNIVERMRITSTGGLAFNGAANYGTSGQVLKSNGDAPPTWGAVDSSTSLTSTYVGFGSSSNILTGSAALRWDNSTFQMTGQTAFDSMTALNVVNGSNDYGRAQIRIVGRIQSSNDGWALGGRNNLIFAANAATSGATPGSTGVDKFALQYQMTDDVLGFVSATVSTSPILAMTQSGNVGIGTSSPVSKLHVAGGGIGTRGAIRISDEGGTNYWEIGRDNASTGNFTVNLNATELLRIDNAGSTSINSTTDGTFSLNKSSGTSWNYINFKVAGTRKFYFGINSSNEPELGTDNSTVFRVLGGMSIAGNTALHAGNYNSYALPLSGGTMTGDISLSDNKLMLRGAGDTNHYLWNNTSDFEEMVYYTGTGFRVTSSVGTQTALFSESGLTILASGGSTTSPNVALILDYESSGTSMAGGGTAIEFRGKSSGGNIANYSQARIRSVAYDSNNAHGIAFDYKNNAGASLAEGFRLDPAGNVGIGTSAPASLFHISGANPQTRLQYTGTAGAFETLVNFVDKRDVINAAIGNNLEDDGVGTAAARLVFKTANAGTLTERMRITSTGNVGIGNSSPTYKLDFAVSESTGDAHQIRFGVNNGASGSGGGGVGGATGGNSSPGTGIVFAPNYTGYTKRSAGMLQVGEGNYFRSGLAFYVNNVTDSTTDWSEALRISSNSNVGIGTAAPTQRLHVVGANSGGGGYTGIFENATNGTNNGGGYLFQNNHSNHSWGAVAEFRTVTGTAGADRPSVIFSSDKDSISWSTGFVTGSDNSFRIVKNHGHRAYAGGWTGNNGGWGTEYLTISTSGVVNAPVTLQQGGNQVLHVGNYNSYAPTLTGGSASGTWGISITGSAATATTAGTASSLSLSNGFTLTAGASTYGQFNSWIHLPGAHGFYSAVNSAHFYPNDASSYCAWQISGTRNNWGGISFAADNGPVQLMVSPSSNETGFHNEGYGWQFRWNGGTLYCHKNNYGGGTSATVLDSSNYNSYAPTLTGVGASGTWGINITGNSATTSQTAFSDLSIVGAAQKYLYINPGNGYEAMVRYNGGSGSGWFVGKRITSQTVGTESFHFYSEAAGKTVAGIDTSGNMVLTGSLSAITKSFLIDHPTKPGMQLRYGSLEGPENGVYVRGRLKGNKIELPEYWTKLVDPDSITVNLTAIGKSQDIYVEDIKDNVVYVGGENVNCFYTVFAERVDTAKLEVEIG